SPALARPQSGALLQAPTRTTPRARTQTPGQTPAQTRALPPVRLPAPTPAQALPAPLTGAMQ
ncbi:hypothetical protein DWU95_04725, partial [Burkholderia contaminans]